MFSFLHVISNRGLGTAGMRHENWQNIQLQKWIAIFVKTDKSHADTSVQFYVKSNDMEHGKNIRRFDR